MPSSSLLELTLYAMQTAAAIVIAALLAHYHRATGRQSLKMWAGSFAALAMYLATAWLDMHWSTESPRRDGSLMLAVAIVSQVAVYCHLALAALGARSAIHGERHDERRVRDALIAAVVVGLVCALAWSMSPHAGLQRAFMRVGLRYVVASACFLTIAVALWRQPRQHGTGVRVAAVALGLYGLELFHVVAVYVWNMRHAQALPWSDYLGVYNLTTELFAGFGLLIWLLEDERSRAQRTDDALQRIRDFDPATGFPNRHRLLADLPGLLHRTNQRMALVLLRLDQADTLSGSHGSAALEAVMADAAARLEQHALSGWPRPSRLSETRLVQPVPRGGGDTALTTLANDLLASMRVPFYVHGQELALSASIGIAVSPEDGVNPDGLIAAAVTAQQRAHEIGGNRFRYFSSEMNSLALTKLGLLGELRQALTRGEMVLHYQPLVSADGTRICGAEALARWQHPQRGLLLPAMFIEELDQLGLIEDLDRHVLQQACREACLWRRDYGSEISVSVNISTRSFQRRRFPDLVRNVLVQSGLEPSRLVLEVVESGALHDRNRAIDTLTRLRELGVRVALDDFGTGYSSLSYLRELPVDAVKIDRSFVVDVVDQPRDAAIAEATITLAHSLGLEVVVEGVETAAQQAWFHAREVDRMQGFRFAPPLAREQLHDRLAAREQSLARAPTPSASL